MNQKNKIYFFSFNLVTTISTSTTTTKKVGITGTLLKTLNGHTNYVRYLAVLPDQTLASASADKTIKIWDTLNGNLLKTLNGHTDWVICLAVLGDNTLASGSDDKTIKIFVHFIIYVILI